VVNRQLRVYGYSGDAELGSHQNNSVILGAPRVLLKTLDGTLKLNTEADLYVAVGPKPSINWHDGRLLQSLPASYVPLHTLYIGLNRALDGPWAPGSGLCAVNVTMMEKEGAQFCNKLFPMINSYFLSSSIFHILGNNHICFNMFFIF